MTVMVLESVAGHNRALVLLIGDGGIFGKRISHRGRGKLVEPADWLYTCI